MKTDKLILINELCRHYEIELSFIERICDIGLLEATQVEDHIYLSVDHVVQLERIIRIHTELEVNVEGIDVILNLLDQIEDLKMQVSTLQNRLILQEDR